MSEKVPQTLKNHGRMDPQFHLILFAVLIINLVFAISFLVQQRSVYAEWLVILAIAVHSVYQAEELSAAGAGPADPAGGAAAAAGAGSGGVARTDQ